MTDLNLKSSQQIMVLGPALNLNRPDLMFGLKWSENKTINPCWHQMSWIKQTHFSRHIINPLSQSSSSCVSGPWSSQNKWDVKLIPLTFARVVISKWSSSQLTNFDWRRLPALLRTPEYLVFRHLKHDNQFTGVLKQKPNFLNCSTGLSTDS